MTDLLHIACPTCHQALTVPVALIGRMGTCPGCAQLFLIPASGDPAAQHFPTSGQPPVPQSVAPQGASENVYATGGVPAAQLAQQPTHANEFSQDRRRILAAISAAPDKYAIVEPFLMPYEEPVAIAVQRQFPFSLFADIVLLSTHRLMAFRRFFTRIDMFDVNYVDLHDVSIYQGFFTSTLTIVTEQGLSCTIDSLVTEQALHVYRLCQDIETKARIARRQFQLEENRSYTPTMQVNDLVAPPDATPARPPHSPFPPRGDLAQIGDEVRNPYRLGE